MNYLSESSVKSWAKWTLLNLVIVALLGVLLRYKMLFPLPSVHYKNLLHGHSHFAFAGWISTALFAAIVGLLQKKGILIRRFYYVIFFLFQLSSFGMLVSFPIQGYALWSIIFSTLSIISSYLFCWWGWRDIRRSTLTAPVKFLFKAALIFFFLSSLGAFSLAFMMAKKVNDRNIMVGAAYFFLHFQYNGWFFLGLLGLFFQKLSDLVKSGFEYLLPAFRILAFSVLPGYLLSVLWMKVPVWIAITAGIAAILQLGAVSYIARHIINPVKMMVPSLGRPVKILWSLSASALAIKILLQALSAVPALSRISFVYRPIIIGYLHLVLLAFVTLFLLGYFLKEKIFSLHTNLAKGGLIIFVTGVILNEVLLMIQGIGVLYNTGIPGMNYSLLGVVSLIFIGIGLFYSQQAGSSKEILAE